jgi:hypothetical protein
VESSNTVKVLPLIAVGKLPVNAWLTTPSVADAFKAPIVACIVVCPTVVAVATPAELMVATFVADELQVAIEATFSLLPSEYVPVRVYCRVLPFGMEAVPGAIASELSVGIVKVDPALATPPTVTTTFPVVAPAGTGTTILVELQFVGVAGVPLKVTVLEPCVAPKLLPAMVTDVPTPPEVGDKLVMLGVVNTVKPTPLLATPETVTTTFPAVAPVGTGTVIELAPQLVGVVAVPLNVTVLVPWLDPKLVPLIFTEVPMAPVVGARLVMLGATVKLNPLLAAPLTVTTTLPLVAPEGTVATIDVGLQPVAVAGMPLNVTVLVPCVASKFVPAIVTDVPTGPKLGDKPVMLGPVPGTVKLTPLLIVPLAVTTTLPVVAPFGTGTLI